MNTGNETLSERQRMRESLDWIRDLKQKDVDRVLRSQTNNGDDLSMKMIYEDCGLETCILLWRKFARMTLHISERPVNELRRIHIRENYKPDEPEHCTKSLAAMLNVSEQFVREALFEDPKEDPRQ